MREVPWSHPAEGTGEAVWAAFSEVRLALLAQAAAVVGPEDAEDVVDEALVRTLEHPPRPAGAPLPDVLARAVGDGAAHHHRRMELQRRAEARAVLGRRYDAARRLRTAL